MTSEPRSLNPLKSGSQCGQIQTIAFANKYNVLIPSKAGLNADKEVSADWEGENVLIPSKAGLNADEFIHAFNKVHVVLIPSKAGLNADVRLPAKLSEVNGLNPLKSGSQCGRRNAPIG